jgi:hypothetical protein
MWLRIQSQPTGLASQCARELPLPKVAQREEHRRGFNPCGEKILNRSRAGHRDGDISAVALE